MPTEENAATTPRRKLRRAGETARAVAVMASEEPVQAIATPIRKPEVASIGTPPAKAMMTIATI